MYEINLTSWDMVTLEKYEDLIKFQIVWKGNKTTQRYLKMDNEKEYNTIMMILEQERTLDRIDKICSGYFRTKHESDLDNLDSEAQECLGDVYNLL